VRDMHPGNGGPLAHCIVCGAPFPLHTIRCGTAS
jgi:predicted nucleic acid-binding Zn ribbon protein